MIIPPQMDKISTRRSGLRDAWNAYMLNGAVFSQNDIPLCPTTASTPPSKLISFTEAKTIHRKELRASHNNYHFKAYIHFYEDDQKFDGKKSSIWTYPEKALDIIRHFAGIIAPDFSTYADFPEPLKRWNFFRMNAFGYWIGSLGIPVISNVRWGTKETWKYCFDGNPRHSMIAIGTVASGIHQLKNRQLFENGCLQMIKILRPHTIITYGSSNCTCFDNLRNQDINMIAFPSKTNEVFHRRKQYE